MFHLIKSQKIYFLFLFIVVVLNYGTTINNGYMIDDHHFLKGRNQSGYQSNQDFFTKTDNQHFIPFYSGVNFMLFENFRDKPYVFHIINIFLFYVSCLLFFLLIVQLSNSKPIAYLATLLMLLHPVNYFPVGYKTANFVFYSAVFMELSLLLAWYAVQGSKKKIVCILMSYGFFVFALLSNHWAALLPFYLAAMLYFVKKFELRRIVIIILPYLLMDSIFLMLYVKIAGSNMDLIGRINSLDLSLFEYLATFSYIAYGYISNLFLPRNIVFMVNMPKPVEYLLFWNSMFFLWIILSFILITFVWKKSLKSLSLIWFLTGFILVFPALFSHSNMGLVFEPHWLYFSSFGFFLMVAIYLDQVRLKINKVYFGAMICGIIIFLFITTQSFNYFTKTEKRYCEFLLHYYPENRIGLTTLGNIYLNEGKYDEAMQVYNKVIELGDLKQYKELNNIGLIFKNLKKNKEAKYYFQKSLQLNPNFTIAYNNLGTVYKIEGDLAQAEYNFKKAIRLNPKFPEPRLNLINVYIQKKDWQEAQRSLKELDFSKMKPLNQRDILIKLAVVLFKIGNVSQSSDYIEQLYSKFNTIETRLILSQEFSSLNMDVQAMSILDVALFQFPRSKEIYLLYGVILGNNENWESAIEMWEKGKIIDDKEDKFDEYIVKAKLLMQKDM